MALKAPKGNSQGNRVEQPILEADVYPGRLVQIIDFGLQAQKPYQGQDKKPVNEIMLTYELSDAFMVDEEGNELEDKPRWISEVLPFYGLFADKAKSTQRYKAFDPTEEFEGDFSKCVGLAANITIVNNVKGEKTYTNVANVAAMAARKAANLPELKNDPKVFDLDDPDLKVFQSFPQWIQDKIKSNLNFKGSKLDVLLGGAKAEDKPKEKKKVTKEDPPFDPDEDDLPY